MGDLGWIISPHQAWWPCMLKKWNSDLLVFKEPTHLFWFCLLLFDNEDSENTGKDWKQKEKRAAEDEMVGWHHRLNGLEFEQVPEVGNGQGSLACCSPWGCRESDTTEQQQQQQTEHLLKDLWFFFPCSTWPYLDWQNETPLLACITFNSRHMTQVFSRLSS